MEGLSKILLEHGASNFSWHLFGHLEGVVGVQEVRSYKYSIINLTNSDEIDKMVARKISG